MKTTPTFYVSIISTILIKTNLPTELRARYGNKDMDVMFTWIVGRIEGFHSFASNREYR